jgi:hypothetical protein
LGCDVVEFGKEVPAFGRNTLPLLQATGIVTGMFTAQITSNFVKKTASFPF